MPFVFLNPILTPVAWDANLSLSADISQYPPRVGAYMMKITSSERFRHEGLVNIRT